jgi:hypothetical protein
VSGCVCLCVGLQLQLAPPAHGPELVVGGGELKLRSIVLQYFPHKEPPWLLVGYGQRSAVLLVYCSPSDH